MNGEWELKNKQILVLGFGVSGLAATSLLLRKGATVWVWDDELNEELADKIVQTGARVFANPELNPEIIDMLVVSPGMPPKHLLYQEAIEAEIPIIGEAELAAREIQGPCVGITGTNGKTTVTMMVAHVLNEAGRKARALGNIGQALTSEVEELEEQEIVVAELSSAQLETLKTPVLDAAVILNLSPDHLDRYENYPDYVAAKFRIGRCLKNNGILFIQEELSKSHLSLIDGVELQTFGWSDGARYRSDRTHIYHQDQRELTLPSQWISSGDHDIENAMAAYALCRQLGLSADEFVQGIKTFKKPLHRLEFVAEIRGVYYYNDSKGTNVAAVMRAVEALKGQIVLIAGGQEKGISFEPWVEAFKGKVKYICVIGEAAPRISREVGAAIPVELCDCMESAVRTAATVAEAGDNVLLSPGAASFDMFKSYQHRGDVFKSLVKSL
ncbi:MAG: UDP-N-acetylmuramoyl-L-alanine--D-glutamate ligase [Waddliaceae bacterium]|nr:UDP-N-acetylmuramoyl-L-alanine--D-glutamate ligase [Waddliaceae bacterium]